MPRNGISKNQSARKLEFTGLNPVKFFRGDFDNHGREVEA